MDNAIDILLGLDPNILSPEVRCNEVKLTLTNTSTDIANILAELSDQVEADKFISIRDTAVEAIKFLGALINLTTPSPLAVLEDKPDSFSLPDGVTFDMGAMVDAYKSAGVKMTDPSVLKIMASLDPKTKAAVSGKLHSVVAPAKDATMQEDIRRLAGSIPSNIVPAQNDPFDIAQARDTYEGIIKRDLSDYEVAICIAEQWRK
jgi:hypothetical protein